MEYVDTVTTIFEREKAAVVVSRKRLAKAAAAVALSEAKVDKQRAQMTTINAQLKKAEDNAAAAANILAALPTHMKNKEEGADNPEYVDWVRNMRLDNQKRAVGALQTIFVK